MADLDWLLSGTPSDFAMPPDAVFEADDENWRSSIERIPVTPGLQVFLNDIEARRNFRAEPALTNDTLRLVGQVPLDGQLDLDLRNGEIASATTQSAVLYCPTVPTVHAFRADIRFRSVGYSLSLERIERQLDGHVPSILRPLLDGGRPPARHIATGNRNTMRALARAVFDRSLAGPLRLLMLEGVVLQLFALQAATPSAGRSHRALSRRDRVLAGEALDRLLADMRRPPSLGELAEATGLSEKRLNACFREVFGTTVFETLRNHRLEHARQALEESALPLKEIAWRVGYGNVSNFVHAFRARYGKPPRQFIEDRG
jgi:AraC-like DNA-binding protein